jgi:MOSC domain-containing protein YiiM
MIEPRHPGTDRREAAPHIYRMERITVHLRHLYVTHRETDVHASMSEEVACLYCIAGHGVVGDRWFDIANGEKGHITFFGADALKRICQEKREQIEPSRLQRNVLIDGVDVDGLIGRRFTVRGVQFDGVDNCRTVTSPGGLRARILNDGWLRPGLADLFVHEEAEPGQFAGGI